ncbi:MAG: DNA-3-methyladenine glycosylase I [Henriciella sp.]|nr:DNA-3-methyladenine glycosylase I [Henriciella sp.]
MRNFSEILALAAQHHGGEELVLDKAANEHLTADLTAIADSHYFSEMTKAVFSAGFNWTVIRNKWPGFEAAFDGFDPHRVAFYSDEDMDRLLSDPGIVRNGQKIKATIDNARFIVETIKQYGSFGAFLAQWPADDQAGLLAYLGKHGARLGGATAQYFLRFSGYDGWITSKDVCAALMREGVLDKPSATSKTALKKVDAAFADLAEQSGLPRSVISRILALSIG